MEKNRKYKKEREEKSRERIEVPRNKREEKRS